MDEKRAIFAHLAELLAWTGISGEGNFYAIVELEAEPVGFVAVNHWRDQQTFYPEAPDLLFEAFLRFPMAWIKFLQVSLRILSGCFYRFRLLLAILILAPILIFGR